MPTSPSPSPARRGTCRCHRHRRRRQLNSWAAGAARGTRCVRRRHQHPQPTGRQRASKDLLRKQWIVRDFKNRAGMPHRALDRDSPTMARTAGRRAALGGRRLGARPPRPPPSPETGKPIAAFARSRAAPAVALASEVVHVVAEELDLAAEGGKQLHSIRGTITLGEGPSDPNVVTLRVLYRPRQPPVPGTRLRR